MASVSFSSFLWNFFWKSSVDRLAMMSSIIVISLWMNICSLHQFLKSSNDPTYFCNMWFICRSKTFSLILFLSILSFLLYFLPPPTCDYSTNHILLNSLSSFSRTISHLFLFVVLFTSFSLLSIYNIIFALFFVSLLLHLLLCSLSSNCFQANRTN